MLLVHVHSMVIIGGSAVLLQLLGLAVGWLSARTLLVIGSCRRGESPVFPMLVWS